VAEPTAPALPHGRARDPRRRLFPWVKKSGLCSFRLSPRSEFIKASVGLQYCR
jgi:hypothetical protein